MAVVFDAAPIVSGFIGTEDTVVESRDCRTATGVTIVENGTAVGGAVASEMQLLMDKGVLPPPLPLLKRPPPPPVAVLLVTVQFMSFSVALTLREPSLQIAPPLVAELLLKTLLLTVRVP